jgi:uncharacterized Zn finger protein
MNGLNVGEPSQRHAFNVTEESAMWYRFKPYVSVAGRRANAASEVSKLKKKGQDIQPIVIEGRKIATSFWGQSWCDNLEAYSDFSNRLPRGRTYVCNGSVVDLQIKPGKITALVSGSSLYRIAIDITKLGQPTWKSIRQACAGQIGSIVELLQGRLSKNVMEIVTRQENGLFPKPTEIRMTCSCPDWAGLCKHLAAVLYGVGARLDLRPELLFLLRQVDHLELIEQAVSADSGRAGAKSTKKTIATGDLADVFGIELDSASAAIKEVKKPRQRKPRGSVATFEESAAADAETGAKLNDAPPRRSSRKRPLAKPADSELLASVGNGKAAVAAAKPKTRGKSRSGTAPRGAKNGAGSLRSAVRVTAKHGGAKPRSPRPK